jgi:uncharacterized membrane protein (UPF0182 family)
LLNACDTNRNKRLFAYFQQIVVVLILILVINFHVEKNNLQCLTIDSGYRGIFIKELIMAFAQTLMVFILIVSFGVLAAVFLFWVNAGTLVQDTPKKTVKKQIAKRAEKQVDSLLDFARWETTTLLLR